MANLPKSTWRKSASPVMLPTSPLMSLGAKPTAARNAKFEALWGDMLSDPPVAYGDPNNFRTNPPDVRPSGGAFCPRAYCFERLGAKKPNDFTVKSNFYTEIGKALHYVVQNAMARSGVLWGLWECARPGCKALHNQDPGFWPNDAVCEKCKNNTWEYRELAVEVPEIGLKGHTDGILIKKTHSSVLEIKTAGVEKVERLKTLSDAQLSHMFSTETPWYGYMNQAVTYATLCQRKFNLSPAIDRVDFLILARDTPDVYAAFTLPVPDSQWWDEIERRIKRAQRARELKILPLGFAEDEAGIKNLPTCRWCAHAKYCLSGNKVKAFLDERVKPDTVASLLDDDDTEEYSMGTVITGDYVDQTAVKAPAVPAEPKLETEEERKKREAEEAAKNEQTETAP